METNVYFESDVIVTTFRHVMGDACESTQMLTCKECTVSTIKSVYNASLVLHMSADRLRDMLITSKAWCKLYNDKLILEVEVKIPYSESKVANTYASMIHALNEDIE